MMRMSNSPSPGSGVGLSVNSKLSRLGAPSGRLLSKIWRLILATIAILLQVATIKSKLMSAGAGEGISRPPIPCINKETGSYAQTESRLPASQFGLDRAKGEVHCASGVEARKSRSQLAQQQGRIERATGRAGGSWSRRIDVRHKHGCAQCTPSGRKRRLANLWRLPLLRSLGAGGGGQLQHGGALALAQARKPAPPPRPETPTHHDGSWRCAC